MATSRVSSLPDLDYGSDRSGPSRTSSSYSLFPVHNEPADFCTPVLSLPPPPSQEARHAVLIPRAYWKRDRDASKCDTLDCATEFSLMERRHHCRKCGGVYCQSCSANTYPLLDTSRMPFFIPPAHMPLPLLAASSPTGGLVESRVCDDCHAQLQGKLAPSFIRRQSAPSSSTQQTQLNCLAPEPESTHAHTSLFLAESPESLHFDEEAMRFGPTCRETYVKKPRHLRGRMSRSSSSASVVTPRSPLSAGAPRRLSELSGGSSDILPRSLSPTPSASAHHINAPLPTCNRASPAIRRGSAGSSSDSTTGKKANALSSYPLRNPSRVCKLNGGAFWEPKPMAKRVDPPVWYEARVPSYVRIVSSLREDDDEDHDDDMPLAPVKRTIKYRDMWSAPFGLPEHQLEPNRESTF
ncbi:hypothetical protein FRB96_003002 [Tulasnella sp. 330]|nr:hypothetical protein FRB96_003002 [Tulasnella sp. 330]KAG8878979.1 hypothetical protein FRB98_005888 [Tulasnella sp. 332]